MERTDNKNKPDETSATERRRFRRRSVKLPVKCRVFSPRTGEAAGVLRGQIRNISPAGALLAGPRPDPEWMNPLLMQRLEVELTFEGAEDGAAAAPPPTLVARCVWLESDGEDTAAYGLSFEELSPEDAARLQRFTAGLSERTT